MDFSTLNFSLIFIRSLMISKYAKYEKRYFEGLGHLMVNSIVYFLLCTYIGKQYESFNFIYF